MYAICLRMTGRAEVADDVCQDVFLHAWRGYDSFRGESTVATWLHRITVRRVLHRRRTDRRYRARVVTDSELAEYADAVKHAMPDTRLDVERAIARLPDGARTVLVLFEIEGYPYREIASLLDVSVGTVRSQLHRARRLMRELL